MTEVTLGFKTTLSQRIESIDMIRGIAIFIMLFVNVFIWLINLVIFQNSLLSQIG